MRLAAATIVASLAWTACSMAGPARAVDIEPGQNVSLKPGEFMQTTDGSLRVGFESVTADSRCPKGEQCVWAGDATVRIWLQQASGPRETRELRVASAASQAANAQNHEVRLVRLDPYPITGKPISKQSYVATLTLHHGAAATMDR